MTKLFTLFTVFFMAACTTMPDETCQDYATRRTAELQAEGYGLVGEKQAPVADGVAIAAYFADVAKGKAVIDTVVSTEEIARLLVTEGFEETGRCRYEEGAWYTLTFKADLSGEET